MKKLMLIVFVLTFLMLIPEMAQAIQVGDPAPEFSGTTIWGESFSLSEVTKDSIVVIFFMGYS